MVQVAQASADGRGAGEYVTRLAVGDAGQVGSDDTTALKMRIRADRAWQPLGDRYVAYAAS
jgi:hypothetical protein